MTSGTSATNAHKKIKRIEGIGGHTPPHFCCVCGKSTKKSEIVSCSPDCPNICHPSCADPSQPFHCSQAQHLRELQGITQTVIVFDEDTHTDQASLSLGQHLINQEDYTKIIQTQQATITKLVKQLSVFVDGSLSLADLPATILSAKELIANCSTPVQSKAVMQSLTGYPRSFPHKLSKIQHFRIGGIILPSEKRILPKVHSCLRFPGV